MSSRDELSRPKANQCSEVIHLLLVAEARENGEMDGMLAIGEAISASLARKEIEKHAKNCSKCRKNGWK